VDFGLVETFVHGGGPEPLLRPRKNMARFQMSQAPSFLMVRGILRPRAKGSEGAVAARAASVIRGRRPDGTLGRL
jgi:hypothetical protein